MRVADFCRRLGGKRFAVEGRDFVEKLLCRCFRSEANRFKRLRNAQIGHHDPIVVYRIRYNDYRKDRGNDGQKRQRNTLANDDQLAKSALFNMGP